MHTIISPLSHHTSLTILPSKYQATSHGLVTLNAPECQQHIKDYFESGVVQFVDGTVCGADFGNVFALFESNAG